jgi:hypothetical protein
MLCRRLFGQPQFWFEVASRRFFSSSDSRWVMRFVAFFTEPSAFVTEERFIASASPRPPALRGRRRRT